jgi:two-component system cell cycle sensor histidine kinase PleC
MAASLSVTDTTAADAREQKLALDQLGLALRNLKLNAWMMPALAAVICVMFHAWIGWPRLMIWFGVVVATCVPLGIMAHRFRPSVANLTAATLCYAVFTIGWSSIGWFLWVPHNDLACLIVIMLIACTVAGNGALVGPSRPLTVVSYTIYGTTLVLTPLQASGGVYRGIAVLAVLYTAYMLFMSRQIFVTARNMLLLRYDKNDLIEALANSKAESDAAREHAEAASRAKSQFLANMSHELRTPLNAILGFSEMITSRIFDARPERHYEYAGLIHDSGHHLLTLINDILDLAKIEAGSWSLRETEIDLGALAADAATMIQPRIAASRCSLSVEVAPHLPLVLCDERAMKQILLNLLSNAVKFTPQGGLVTVFVRTEADGGIVLGVSDTGVGIAPEDQQRVFQNFGQGRHDVVTADKGTGLGLPIVKGLVEAHDGRIALESEIGEGTTVTVHLPARRAGRALAAAS